MKIIRVMLAIMIVTLMATICTEGQTVQRELIVTLDGGDYGPPVGKIYGSMTYHFTFKLSKDGLIESIHWNITDCDLWDENGVKARIIDTGHDNLGAYWGLFNSPNGQPFPIYFNVENGWLEDYMPWENWPVEGICNNTAFQVMVKGQMVKLPLLIIYKMNANGDVVVDIVKM